MDFMQVLVNETIRVKKYLFSETKTMQNKNRRERERVRENCGVTEGKRMKNRRKIL